MTLTCKCLENATDENCRLVIDQMLREGNVATAFHIFLAIANNIKSPPKKETLIALLNNIDSAANLESIPEGSKAIVTEAELVHQTSIKLENTLSKFAESKPGTGGTLELDSNAARVLRLYSLYGEPVPRSKTAQEIGVQKPDLCLKHIPHPSSPVA